MQLTLFQWDLIEVGNGFDCLARLACDQAEAHFVRVLSAQPGHLAATEGLRATRHWRSLLRSLATGQTETALTRFWQQVQHFSFPTTAAGQALRRALLRRLLVAMEQTGVTMVEPDLCTGYLHLLLGEHVEAEKQLRHLIDTFPDRGLLYGYLADTLWQQGRREIANGVYAAALLLAPEAMAAHATLRNQGLKTLIAEHGAPLTPVHGFFLGVLPLVEPEREATTEAGRIYAMLHRAERARQSRDFSTMASARRDLHQQAPDIFSQYLAWLQRDAEGETQQRPD
jgi:tetratricopeptide (TPR) repeat protein